MIVPDWVRKCVVFIGYKMADGEMRFAGSGFFLGRPPAGYVSGHAMASGLRLITARHVIEGIRKKGLTETFIRVNTKSGGAVWSKCEGEWRFHPTDSSVDTAILFCGIPNDWDHIAIPTSVCATSKVFAEQEVALGDEVFIVGLFHRHHGKARNIPIVRVGNLAALSEEKVETAEFGLIDAHLIEARSIGGLSGSPVFLNLGIIRQIGKQIVNKLDGPVMFLLGLVHGHYDVPAVDLDISLTHDVPSITTEKINTGIALVVPIEKVMEAFDIYSPLASDRTG